MKILGVGRGDKVLVPTMTFVASANAVEHAGATPVFVDSEPGTGLIDLGGRSRRDAAPAGDHAGAPRGTTGRYGSSQSSAGAPRPSRDRGRRARAGAEWRGQRIGTHGNLAAYSFYVTKSITTIEGGALATDDPKVSAEVERLALHGLSLGAWQRFSDTGFKHYEVEEPGFKFNMTDVQAALGLHQLPRLDDWSTSAPRSGLATTSFSPTSR